jgi:hypothetical protein
MTKQTALLAALVLGAAVVAFTGAGDLAAAPARRFSLAVLRRDGVLLPFADYDRGHWSSYWPTPTANRDVPLTIAGIPRNWWPDRKPLPSWIAWPLDGQSRAITVSAPAWVAAHCLMNVGLKTDYQGHETAPPPQVQPYPKDGIATVGDVTIERVDVLDPASPEWAQVTASISGNVSRAETRSLTDFAGRWTHPLDIRGRAATPLQLEVLCRSLKTASGAVYYYFEGTKHYKNPRDVAGRPPCDIVTFTTGWVSKAPDGQMDGIVNAAITDCRMEAMLYRLPLGQIRIDQKLFWIVQVSGWQYERYDVLDVNAEQVKTAFTTAGGGCAAQGRSAPTR